MNLSKASGVGRIMWLRTRAMLPPREAKSSNCRFAFVWGPALRCAPALFFLFRPASASSDQPNSQIHPIQIGLLNTAYDLHCQIYRNSNSGHRIVTAGRELKLAQEPSKTLKELGILNNSTITIYMTGTTAMQASVATLSEGPVQPDVMRNFGALYSLLELPEFLSAKAGPPPPPWPPKSISNDL